MYFSRLRARLRRWRARRETIRALAALDDRELDDLGIGRWRIRAIAARDAG